MMNKMRSTTMAEQRTLDAERATLDAAQVKQYDFTPYGMVNKECGSWLYKSDVDAALAQLGDVEEAAYYRGFKASDAAKRPNNGDVAPAVNLAEAVHAAVAAIYFDDSSDYLPALYSVVGHLAPHLAHELVSNPRSVWEQTDAARCSPVADAAAGELPVKPWYDRITENERMHNDAAIQEAMVGEIADLRAQLARTSAPEGAPVGMVPDILFDGHAVYYEVMANDPHTPRPTADNIADVLDAVVRLIRRAAPTSASAQPAEGNHVD
jgi:hypothetical protein